MEKTVLIYHFSKERAANMKKALGKLSIGVREVKPEEYLLPLGNLAGVKGMLPLGGQYEGEEMQQEMVVFSGISQEELDKVLLAFRQNGLAGIALKAMLTPTNQFWSSVQLYEELKREHAAMHPGS